MTESTALQGARLTLNSSATWAELWTVQVTDSTARRITSNTESVTFDGYTFTPYPISRAEITRGSKGEITSVSIVVPCLTQIDYSRLSDLRGRRAMLQQVNTAALSSSSNCYQYNFIIQSVVVRDFLATVVLGGTNLNTISVPAQRINRTRCRWLPRYGEAECGYDTTRSGALSSCDGTLDGANGCTAHGTDEVAAGRARLHPLRFGGEPDVAKGPYA